MAGLPGPAARERVGGLLLIQAGVRESPLGRLRRALLASVRRRPTIQAAGFYG
jgi:hypothetical protein